jgi:hypothetical protein
MKPCKKHDKISECGDCGMRFYCIPLSKLCVEDHKELLQRAYAQGREDAYAKATKVIKKVIKKK